MTMLRLTVCRLVLLAAVPWVRAQGTALPFKFNLGWKFEATSAGFLLALQRGYSSGQGIAAIEGWPRLSAVATSGGQRIACDLLVLAEEVQPWPAFPPGPNIFYAGSASLGPCDAEMAAAHGADVGRQAVAVA